ncbi:hypothetical protein SteCoe_34461 [Stentor coeruleus]|uniref:Uncharacterized protein n=1 Tax=Stentor coeruleus TaxID=5963 RepID=A0A1R2AUH3_9CILI|nr:hypothetical protein SteCoe_34461 [Stentor coeruleus]
MHYLERESRVLEESKSREQFSIPSSIVSRIGPPETNLVESSSLENFRFSFAETQAEIEAQNFLQIISSGNPSLSKAIVLKELESMKMQMEMINKKLEYNLSILKENQERQELLAMIEGLINYEIKRNKTTRQEIMCSCSKNCSLF